MHPILIIGVAGSGKSTVGDMLATRLGGEFLDADNFHPERNVRKMAGGMALDDADRQPWLKRLVHELKERRDAPQPVVLACSALKESYRAVFKQSLPDIRIVYLMGSYTLISDRMIHRKGHFFKQGLLESQFADLEEPVDALTVSIDQPMERIVEEIVLRLGLTGF